MRGNFLVAIVVRAFRPGRPITDTSLPVEVQTRRAVEYLLTTPKARLITRAVTRYTTVAAGDASLM